MTKERLYFVAAILILIVGLVLRVSFYISSDSLWHDECSLALNLGTGFDIYFHPLKYLQMAPPLFMCLTNVLVNIFGLNEYVLRLIPLFSGLLSLPAFYFLSKDVFKNKSSIIIANLIFALNYPLICYCAEFKQYSTEVLVSVLCLYFLTKLDIRKVTVKRLLVYSLVLALAPVLSFTSLFIIVSWLLLQLFGRNKEDFIKLIVLISFSALLFIIYTLSAIIPNIETAKYMGEYWQNGFIGVNPLKFIILSVKNLNYFFFPNNFVLLDIIVFVIGWFCADKKTFAFNVMKVLLIFSILVAILRIYPFDERTILYLLPFIILIMSAVFEKVSLKKGFSILIISMFIVVFGRYISVNYFVNIIAGKQSGENAKAAMSEIIKSYKSGDVIVYNDASFSEYLFYCRYFNFYPHSDAKIMAHKSKTEYFKLLNSLPKGRVYWFYYPFDYSTKRVIPYLKEWGRAKNILSENMYKGSYVLKLEL